jgi:hypothetical protein
MSTEKLEADSVLVISLQAAVPLRIMELRRYSAERLIELAREAGQHVASHGDDILFRSKKKGATAEAFNQLVTGLAAAALVVPGGITFAGCHWCDDHRACEQAIS